MRRFYATPNQFQGNEVHLNFDESKHLRDVLRLRVGDEVSVFDGEGSEFECRVKETGKNKTPAILEIISESQPPVPESALDLTLAVALMKGEKFDLVVQKATELGVRRIVPLQTKRADVKIKDEGDATKKLERWRRIALEAAKQSGRAKIPQISGITKFENLLSETAGTKLFFSERNGTSLSAFVLENAELREITAIIGPEGGWDDSEIAAASENIASVLTLGGRILRAETAAIAITALLQNLFGDLR